jgi:ABC-type Fe3+-hydroxamate transport system substrate-binding protein
MLNRKSVRDMMGFVISVPENPLRIVSLVPSQTELICDLGLADRLYGVTKFCIHPEEIVSKKTVVGGTKTFHSEAIRVLNPDLIIANKEENDRDLLLNLKKHYPVWISDVKNLEECRQMISEMGTLLNREEDASFINRKIEEGFAGLPTLSRKIKTAYLIWRNPFMSANADTFINDIMQRCGLENVFAHKEVRYPEISAAELKAADPELILLSSEPYPFSEKHFAEIEEILPNASLALADGEMFSWYGSRMMFAPVYLRKLSEDILQPISSPVS